MKLSAPEETPALWKRLVAVLPEGLLVFWLGMVHLAALFFVVVFVHDSEAALKAMAAGPQGATVIVLVALLSAPGVLLWQLTRWVRRRLLGR